MKVLKISKTGLTKMVEIFLTAIQTFRLNYVGTSDQLKFVVSLNVSFYVL